MAKFNKVNDVYVNIEKIAFIKPVYEDYNEKWLISIETTDDHWYLSEYYTKEDCEKAIEELLGF